MKLAMTSPTPDLKQQEELDVKTLEIKTSSGYSHPNPMSEELKIEKQRDLDSIAELFEEDLRDKGDYDPSKVKWTSDNSVVIRDLPKMSLHNFILKAESMGLNISYTKETIIKISN